MHMSYFDRTPPHLLRHRSHSYYIRDGKRTAAPFDADTGVTVSNGGLNAPMPDMARYAAFLLGDPVPQVADVMFALCPQVGHVGSGHVVDRCAAVDGVHVHE